MPSPNFDRRVNLVRREITFRILACARDSIAAGDTAQAELCAAALDGNVEARETIVRRLAEQEQARNAVPAPPREVS